MRGLQETPAHCLCLEALSLAEARDLGARLAAALRDRLAGKTCVAGLRWGCAVLARAARDPRP